MSKQTSKPNIQLLGLRAYQDNEGKWKNRDAFHEMNWRVPSVADLFANIDTYVEQIPAEERFNMFYTVARCKHEKRKFAEQHELPIDIDNIDVDRLNLYIEPVCRVLGVNPDDVGTVFTGHGLHFLIGLKNPITSTDFFDETKAQYKMICTKIDKELSKSNLPGNADPSIFDNARILRLPNTLNKKPNKSERMAYLINNKIIPSDFDIYKVSGLPQVADSDALTAKELRKYPPADTNAVLEGCAFLKYAKENPHEMSEPQWYAMLSILGRIKEGEQLAHDYSSGHPCYTREETDQKLSQAIAASGPRTCKNINFLWDKCQACPNFEKVISPIVIRGSEYIKTKEFGFRNFSIDPATGAISTDGVNFQDLRLQFEMDYKYKADESSGEIFAFSKTHYKEFSDARIGNFVQGLVNPPANNQNRKEFLSLLKVTNLMEENWKNSSTMGYKNMKNGVLKYDDQTLLPHAPDYFFRNVSDFDFEIHAKCSTYDKFIKEITGGREELERTIDEFLGYCLSNDPCWLHKAMILIGTGRNGKSTLLNLVKKMAGPGNYEALSIKQLSNDFSLQTLDGKLFNLTEEMPSREALQDDKFKTLVAGGDVLVSKKNKTPYTMKNKAKFLFSANGFPVTSDISDAYFERLILIPFDKRFTHEQGNVDPFLEEKLYRELPGIFNRYLNGFLRLKKRGGIDIGPEVRGLINEYKNQSDPFINWFEEYVRLLPLSDIKDNRPFASNFDIYHSYSTIMKIWNVRPIQHSELIRRVKQHIADSKDRVAQSRQGGAGSPKRGLTGLEIIPSTTTNY